MKKQFIITGLIAFFSLFSTSEVKAEDNIDYQVVITSDGHQHVFPPDTKIEHILFYIEWYEHYLEVKEWYDKQGKFILC